jgi:hypothetical protein
MLLGADRLICVGNKFCAVLFQAFDKVKCFSNWFIFVSVLAFNWPELKALEQWHCFMSA